MGKKDFDDFIKKQEAVEQETKIVDWEKVKNDWLEQVDAFYATATEILKEYIDARKVKINFENITLYEEKLGSYQTKKLTLFMGGQQVDFTPIGTILFGAHGRIDMEGNAGKVKFILTDKEAKGASVKVNFGGIPKEKEPKKEIVLEWKISTPPPRIKYIEINEESFLDALMEVING